MQTQKNQAVDRIYNIKGLSWMLKSSFGTSSVCSTNSSNIDQQFKIFKLKDQKKKWKKKINKKFQSVGDQIETVIRHKYSSQQPFDANCKKDDDLKHTPHLRHSKTSMISNHSLALKTFRCSFTSSQKSRVSQKQFEKSPFHKENQRNQYKNASLSMALNPYETEKRVIQLRKVFGDLKNENQKVRQSSKMMKIHQRQKEFLDRKNQEFFRRELEWIDNKVHFYNQFDIMEYEKNLIQKKFKGEK